MSLLTTRQLARKADLPYLNVLRWVKDGILRPKLEMGTVRKIGIFDEDQIAELRLFAHLRSSFPHEFWPMLGDAIRLAMNIDEERVFIVQIAAEEGGAQLEAVTQGDLDGFLMREDLRMLIPIQKGVDVQT